MVEFAHILRQQYILALGNLVYKNVVIPVKDEAYYGDGASLPEGRAYIILTNQTSNQGIDNKCTKNYLASIQVHIVTKFNPNSGGTVTSEEISALVLNRIKDWPFDTKSKGITTYKPELESNRSLFEDGQTSRIFRKILIFTHNINE